MARRITMPWDDEDWVWPLTFRQAAVITMTIITVIAVSMGLLLGGKSAFVDGTSMDPTLKDGDMLYGVRNPDSTMIHRGSIIVFRDDNGWSTKNRNLVKRVIAVPGDAVSLDDSGRISVNGHKVYGEDGYNAGAGAGGKSEVTIPKGMYWVRGDNVNVSNDSRRIYCYNRDKGYLVREGDVILLATRDIGDLPFRKI